MVFVCQKLTPRGFNRCMKDKILTGLCKTSRVLLERHDGEAAPIKG